eukprot:1137947-Pelagomonas_calceolata.AAC.7
MKLELSKKRKGSTDVKRSRKLSFGLCSWIWGFQRRAILADLKKCKERQERRMRQASTQQQSSTSTRQF